MTHNAGYPGRPLPGPWTAHTMPDPLPRSPLAFVRSHMWPRFARQFLSAMGVPMASTMVSPAMAVSSYSKSPAGAMGVIAQEREAMSTLRDVAFARHTGLDRLAARPDAIIRTNMPPVMRPRIRSGAGVVPYHSISFQPRSQPPEAVVATIDGARAFMHQERLGGERMAQVMRDRAGTIRRAFGRHG